LTIAPRCATSYSSGGTAGTTVSVSLASWTNCGAGPTGTAPAAGDQVEIVGLANTGSGLTVQQTAGAGNWTITTQLLTGLTVTEWRATRIFNGIETNPTFTFSTSVRITYSAVAVAPTPGSTIVKDTEATVNVDTTAATTHNANSAAVTAGYTDCSLVLLSGRASANGNKSLTFTAPTNWTIPSGGSISNSGTTSTLGFGTSVAYRTGVTGTVSPGAETFQGGSATNGTTYAIVRHLLIREMTPKSITGNVHLKKMTFSITGAGISVATGDVKLRKMFVSGSDKTLAQILGFTVLAASDEFNQSAATWGDASLATKLTGWAAKTYTGGSGVYYNGWNEIQLTGNALQLRCRYEGGWVGAFIESSGKTGFLPPYYVECRAKMDSIAYGFVYAPGWTWYKPNGGTAGVEIDYGEFLGKSPTDLPQTVQGITSGLTKVVSPDGYFTDWKVYSAAVYADRVDFYIDGVLTTTTTTDEMVSHGGVRRDVQADMCISIWEGGSWAGTPSTSDSPQQMTVDWVRAWTMLEESNLSGDVHLKKMNISGTGSGISAISGFIRSKKMTVSASGTTFFSGKVISGDIHLKKMSITSTGISISVSTGNVCFKKMTVSGSGTKVSTVTCAVSLKKMRLSITGLAVSVITGSVGLKKMRISVTGTEVSVSTGAVRLKKMTVSGSSVPVISLSGDIRMKKMRLSSTGVSIAVITASISMKKMREAGTGTEISVITAATSMKKMRVSGTVSGISVATGEVAMKKMLIVVSGDSVSVITAVIAMKKMAVFGTSTFERPSSNPMFVYSLL
jgi:Glycosyl hydrolases family 16